LLRRVAAIDRAEDDEVVTGHLESPWSRFRPPPPARGPDRVETSCEIRG
jgi:hypothetical protein